MDDAALAARIVAGEERAIEMLSERFGASMRAVAMRVTRSERVAEEVVQDALMAIWRDPGRYDPARGSLGPWLLTLTRYKAIDAVRREIRRLPDARPTWTSNCARHRMMSTTRSGWASAASGFTRRLPRWAPISAGRSSSRSSAA